MLSSRIIVLTLLICSVSQKLSAQENGGNCNRFITSSSSHAQVLDFLTQPCAYDRHERPSLKSESVVIYVRVYIYYIKYERSRGIQFKVQLLLQLRWKDARLKYNDLTRNITHISGENNVASKIWTPNLYLTNEKFSLSSDGGGKTKVLASAAVLPDGTVFYTTRWKANLICRSKLGRFPFDKKKCHFNIDTWKFHSEDISLEWEKNNPVTMGDRSLFLVEYRLISAKPIIGHNFKETDSITSYPDYNCSSLAVSFLMSREYGFYVMDYYVPSILLVIVSWVSFWAAPDATPGRTIIGTATMLTFISLNVDVGKSLPNVSYIRSNDLWFIACTAFIFFSLAEFAFVNTIWRYGTYKVEMKKATSKYILKSSMQMRPPLLSTRRRSVSCPTSPTTPRKWTQSSIDNERTVKSLSELDAYLPMSELKSIASDSFEVIDVTPPSSPPRMTTTMTMQEIAVWIDRRSRMVFPISFFVFNIIYWSLLRIS